MRAHQQHPPLDRHFLLRNPLRSSSGITRSLLTMVDSATLATITMPVAADNPPM